MKFTASVSLLTLASIASAATSFSVVSIRSGSSLQYASLYNKDGTVYLGSGDAVELAINDDGTLVDKKTKKYIDFKDDSFVEGSTGTKKVAIKDGNLTFDGKETFIACPSGGNTYKLSANSQCENGVGIRLKTDKEQKIDDIKVGGDNKPADKPADKPAPKAAEPAPKAAPAPAQGEKKFGIVSVASGTQFQYAPIKKVDAHVHVFSVGGNDGKEVSLTLHGDGTLSDQDGRKIRVNENGELGDTDPWGIQQPSKDFAINDGHLTFQGKDNFRACPSGDNKFSLANNDCVGGTGIVLHVIDLK